MRSEERPADPGEEVRRRAWTIADRLARAGGEEAWLISFEDGYRVELRSTRPAPDVPGVLAALALGDRWGHRRSVLPCTDGLVQDTVWSEVRLEPPDGPGRGPEGRTSGVGEGSLKGGSSGPGNA
ncbi:hypothetical protein OU787_06540 [Kitasatospora sp. YST-16]|uniref:hypothetical protein n=1 Tax=unclassified Kitasatospora TaxID=2633591 RepID=UPI0004C3D465|nr:MULTISPECIES: hypothetical protein [unclassified Kitasatospora]WAL71184.1 hypothetical protein OU787_06540 [Kitasatospora sp. YST-16]WNW37221.1 hypothetical protein RKE32_06490 [Streptomyces sp. Li-HN-5-13]